jgi:hypothetical protein
MLMNLFEAMSSPYDELLDKEYGEHDKVVFSRTCRFHFQREGPFWYNPDLDIWIFFGYHQVHIDVFPYVAHLVDDDDPDLDTTGVYEIMFSLGWVRGYYDLDENYLLLHNPSPDALRRALRRAMKEFKIETMRYETKEGGGGYFENKIQVQRFARGLGESVLVERHQQDLWHFTPNLPEIIHSGHLKTQWQGQGVEAEVVAQALGMHRSDVGDKYPFGVSFARSKDNHYARTNSDDNVVYASILMDGRKLSYNHRIIPVTFGMNLRDRKEGVSETEERLITKERSVPFAASWIKRIDVLLPRTLFLRKRRTEQSRTQDYIECFERLYEKEIPVYTWIDHEAYFTGKPWADADDFDMVIHDLKQTLDTDAV